jgi:hypothetical protein
MRPPLAQRAEADTGRVDQVGGFLDVPAQTAMGLRHDRRQQIAEQRGGPVAVGLGQRRALDRIAAQRGQRRRVALQFRHDRPKALRPRQLTVQQGHKLAFAVQTARAAIRVITLDQLREAGVRNMLQNFRQHGMVVGHGVAPVSAPDRRKRPECEDSQCRAPDQANSVPDSRGITH